MTVTLVVHLKVVPQMKPLLLKRDLKKSENIGITENIVIIAAHAIAIISIVRRAALVMNTATLLRIEIETL